MSSHRSHSNEQRSLHSKTTIGIALLALLMCFSACGKDELDAKDFVNNPFDRDYTGPRVFSFDTTYMETVTFPGGQFIYQVISFDVDESLFLAPANYSVKVVDKENGSTTVLAPNPPGSSHFTYYKNNLAIGTLVCLDLHLFNNQSAARAEEICATLQ